MVSTDPFAEADEDTGETKQSQNYIHIRIQRMLTSHRSPAVLATRFSREQSWQTVIKAATNCCLRAQWS
jgi:hypothetical protein